MTTRGPHARDSAVMPGNNNLYYYKCACVSVLMFENEEAALSVVQRRGKIGIDLRKDVEIVV